MLMTLDKVNSSALRFNIDVAKPIEIICQPLFNHFHITNFGYVKIFQDGTMLRVSTDGDWNKKYFENQFYNDTQFYDFDNLTPNTSHMRIFTNQPEEEVFKALFDHNIWNIFSIFNKHETYAEVWFFATTREKTHMINFYLNHLNILKDFIEYFKIQATPILANITSKELISTELKVFDSKILQEKKLINFLKEIGKTNEIYKNISQREKECLQELIMGKTAKEVAKSLKISPRTVETHINNIKKKTGCHKVSQLINLIYQHKI